jgi:SAM-dependent methyltransferase
LTVETDIKREVREFYDSVGWKGIGQGLYQNARYEDLRPVSRNYIHRCHLRVKRFIPQQGEYLLDAGSGPIQYPEYLEYSKGFRYRVCLDISMLALKEARERIGEHGLFVQGDIANLPFKSKAFEGSVSLHTWAMKILDKYRDRRIGEKEPFEVDPSGDNQLINLQGTFTFKHDYGWIKSELKDIPGLEIRVWRSVSTAFMRAFIHRKLLGGLVLVLLYLLEEAFPHILGKLGQYPLILFQKPVSQPSGERS